MGKYSNNYLNQRSLSTIKQQLLMPMKGKTMAPQRCPIYNPWNLGIYYFMWHKGLADVLKGMDLEMEDYFGLPSWIQCNYKCHNQDNQRRKDWMGHCWL